MADLKGKTVALQQGGPHVGMLDDVLKSARLTWNDIKVVWTKDLTASPDSPAEQFRKRTDIDACFAITPDMAGLTGGLRSTGSGAEGTVKGSRVLVSTAELSRSIADVYVCRKDFYDANKEWVGNSSLPISKPARNHRSEEAVRDRRFTTVQRPAANDAGYLR
jgi:ABC-type nitrate/sulfonate/bicarbonate transport system substrate-binding protein